MSGKKNAKPPKWIIVYEMAKEFNIPPWEVEQNCSAKWRKQFLEHRIATNVEEERKVKKRGKRGNTRRKN